MRFASTLVILSDLIARSLIFVLRGKAAWKSSPQAHMASAFAVEGAEQAFSSKD